MAGVLQPTDDEVDLELLLRLATEQAGYRPAFNRKLMNEFALVPVPPALMMTTAFEHYAAAVA